MKTSSPRVTKAARARVLSKRSASLLLFPLAQSQTQTLPLTTKARQASIWQH